MIKKIKNGFFVLLLSTITFNCSSLRQLNIFPVSKDIELGKQVDAEIRNNTKEYPILKNKPHVQTYIENIGKKVLASPHIKYSKTFAYKFEVIDDDSTVNAFCIPGGYIYVYTGLIKFVDNEATLAGIIAHEIAHAELRHSTKKITQQLGIQVALELASGRIGTTGTQVAGAVAVLGLLKFSRVEEEEADAYSFKYLQATEYYPGAIKYFFEKVGLDRKGSAFEKLLSTHPLPKERFDHINKLIIESGIAQPSEANLFTERYNKFKNTLN